MTTTETAQREVLAEAPSGALILAAEFAEIRRELAGIRAEQAEQRADGRAQRATLDRIAAALLGRADQ